MQIGVRCTKVVKGKVSLIINERRKRPGVAYNKRIDVMLTPVEARMLGSDLLCLSERAGINSTLADVDVPQPVHDKARYLVTKGQRINAVKEIREKTGFTLKEGLAYIRKHFPRDIYG